MILGVCLLPYLISSVYSLANALWDAGGAANWLWGDWINSLVDGDGALYMLLSEGPMCCVGALALLIIVVGVVSMISGADEDGELDAEGELEEYEDWETEEGDEVFEEDDISDDDSFYDDL
jgi:hypothetical protein